MATVADIIMHLIKKAWVNTQQLHPILRTPIDTASISDIFTSSSVESSLATSTGTTRITDQHHQHNSSVAAPVAPPATPPIAPPVANEPPDAAYRVFHATDRTVSVQGKEVMLVEQIPDTHDLVCKSYLSKLKRKANQLDTLTKQVSGAKYNGTEEGNRLYGAIMMALSPQTSSDNMSLIVPISYTALFANAKIPIDPKALACSSPGATTLKSLVGEAAVDSMYSALAEINTEQSRIILICDKGPNGNFVKFLSWYYSRAEQRVKTFNLDNDEVGGISADCAKAIRHSLFEFFGDNNARGALWGQCIDSGGGGTGKSFFKCMKVEGLTVEVDQYMISFCTLHCLQLTLGVPVKTILGDGGLLQGKALFNNTAMQLLHGVYNLQDNHEKAEWKTIWKWAAVRSGSELGNETVPSIPCPIATHWWTIGVAAVFLLENWDVIAAVVQGVINRLVTSKKENQIASGIQQSLMAEPAIKSDVHLIAAYHNHFLFSNFAWLQKGDPENGDTPGFFARHIAVRHFHAL
eukprot:scaffold217766_cov49-Attheya_sp.AAC.2